MSHQTFNAEYIKELALGRWPEIHSQLGLKAEYLRNRHGPCPFCGGRDRYRFDNINQTGTFFCNSCGAGDGFNMAARLLGLDIRTDFPKILAEIGHILGAHPETRPDLPQRHAAPPKPEPPKLNEKARQKLREVMTGTLPYDHPDSGPLRAYLSNRGLGAILQDFPDQKVMRFHPSLEYWDTGKKLGEYPAIISMIQNQAGEAVSLHRTYLTTDGHKAPVPSPKKLMAGIYPGSVKGAAVCLYEPSNTLAVAEGVETALAIRVAIGVPVWAIVSSCESAFNNNPLER